MNELAAIRARRDAVTPGVWEVGSMYTTGDAVVGVTDNRIVCVLGAEEQCHTDAAFIAAAPGDVDTLLTLVEQRDARIDALMAMWQANTDALAALTAERDALREQLQQAQQELAAVPVDAMRLLLWGDATQPGYANAVGTVGDWLIAEQDAANAAAELRAPTYNGGCW